MIKCLAGSLRAALSVALLAGAGSALAADNVAALIGGDNTSGDQATVALDSTVPNAFSYQRPAVGASTVTAYLNAHVFCAQAPRAESQVTLLPRYQQPVSQGSDVWRFPDVFVQSLVYRGKGVGNAGAPALIIGEAIDAANKQFRCLTSMPTDSILMPNVSHGLFDSGFGSNVTPTVPSGPQQNVTVTGQTFAGFSGQSVSVIKIATQFDFSAPAPTTWTLVDAINTGALSGSANANWCGLPAVWVEGTPPPVQLCDDPALAVAGVVKETGLFVRHQYNAAVGSSPHYVLVYRPVVGTATSGTPKQGFAALLTGGGMSGESEESQDWFTDDSVWYNY